MVRECVRMQALLQRQSDSGFYSVACMCSIFLSFLVFDEHQTQYTTAWNMHAYTHPNAPIYNIYTYIYLHCCLSGGRDLFKIHTADDLYISICDIHYTYGIHNKWTNKCLFVDCEFCLTKWKRHSNIFKIIKVIHFEA